MNFDLSILIPARNEMFLAKTVEDILLNSEGNTEVIIGLDGAWADPVIKDNSRVTILHHSESVGQRAITNELARLSKAKYLVKCDAHCSFDKGFDVKLMASMQDNWTMVPIMRNLHAFDWVCPDGHRRYQSPSGVCKVCGKETKRDIIWIGKGNPASDSYCFDATPHFQYFREWRKSPTYKEQIKTGLTDTMSLQGSFFMMTRDKYWELNVCDESFGSWGSQGIEVAMKTRLSGGKVIVNHNTWYAHLFRTQGGDFSFPYKMSYQQQENAKSTAKDIFFNAKWDKQIYPLSKVIEQFYPIPGWKNEELKSLKQQEMKIERSGIYSIKSLTNGRIYIGSAINMANRIFEHTRKLKQNNHCNIYLQNTWNKYGENDLEFSVLYFCKEEDLLKNEQKFIDEYKEKVGWDNMFNINPTAGSSLGCECSQETKDKISISQTGKEAWNKGLTKETDERVKKYADKLNGMHTWENREHPKGFLGKTHTEEEKQKISESMQIVTQNKIRNENGQFIKTQEDLKCLK
jgi:group I intron endonuclease